MKHDINKWIFEIPLEDVRDKNHDFSSQSDCECFLCGKLMKKSKVKYMVHLLTNGNLVSSLEEFDNSQGCFEIGADCKNKLPNNFYFKAG